MSLSRNAMILETIVVGRLAVNCYVLACAEGSPAVIIDPGDEGGRILEVLKTYSLTPECVINTHGHFDHICADDAFNVPVYVHPSDEPMLRSAAKNFSAMFASSCAVRSPVKALGEGTLLRAAGMEFEVLHTPGHTPGGVCLRLNGLVFTGDTLFAGGIGRSDIGGDERQLMRSIREKLLVLPDETRVFPGHGPSSTIGREKHMNPFLAGQ